MTGVNVGSAVLEVWPSARGFGARLQAGLGDQMSTAGRQAGEDFSSSMGAHIKSSARTIFAGIAVGAGALAGVGIAGAKMGLEVAAGNEQAQISFTTMLGSAEKAQSFLGKMQQFAAQTPFEFPELQTAASSLISAGVNADKVIPIMRTLGDVTSGMGTGSEGVQRATIALQQMAAAGRITGEDLNQLRDAGVPVFDLLAAATGKSKEEVAALAQSGKLGKKEMEQLFSALESGKGLERFSGLMDKQSQSLTGLISTFKDTLGQGLAQAVQPAIPLIKDGLGKASEFLAAQLPTVVAGVTSLVARITQDGPKVAATLGEWKYNAEVFFDALRGFEDDAGESAFAGRLVDIGLKLHNVREAAAGLFELFQSNEDGAADRLSMALGMDDGDLYAFKDTVLSIKDSIAEFFRTLTSGDLSPLTEAFAKLGPIAKDASASLPAVNSALDTTGTVFGFVADHIDLVVKAMPYLLGAFAAYKTLQAANNVIGKESLIGFGLQTGATIALATANFALAKSNKAAATSSVEATAAENVGLLSRLRMTAATIAGAVASGVARVATIAWTAVQWLLNVALTANPIGLIVLGIGALIAIIVVIATKTTWFQTIWEYTWGAIQAIVKFVWNDVLQPFVNSMITGFSVLTGWVADLLDALSNVPGFGWAKDAADKLRTASDFAANLAANIQKIPDHKTVDVDVNLAVNGSVDGVIAGIAARAGRNASGTDFWRGGWTWVGEQGPELLNLPRGSQVLSSRDSMALVGSRTAAFDPAPPADARGPHTVQYFNGPIVTEDPRRFEQWAATKSHRAAIGEL